MVISEYLKICNKYCKSMKNCNSENNKICIFSNNGKICDKDFLIDSPNINKAIDAFEFIEHWDKQHTENIIEFNNKEDK